ncbi:hypothetical protein [Paractinoplanes toevensis]|uniref:Uncharacterized protein n=1 Tax=Paractinoplanes toevensis TaxID=571911 RepID=A0A919T8K6_9ACTN|nr:hypothetical protein [Actinoplanes toevensis]GIM89699.1 hypothetical protein Ato02nite_014920 [Actinoplanes toevensis]
MRTFMDDLRAGWTSSDKVDNYIDRWHDGPSPFGPKLHEFLGLTWNEYKRFVERNELPRLLDHPKACGAAEGSRWGYLPCGCTHDGYGGHQQ